MRRVHLIAGARPNFMKVAPVFHALAASPVAEPVLVHTGQHYDPEMSQAFLDDLRLPAPHHALGVGSGSHAVQTAAVMTAYEQVVLADRPDLVMVVGDVNSTIACALTATKLGLPVAHLEAGLRSGDRSMPEEVNRVLTDAIADLLLTPSPDGDANLAREGVPAERVVLVGNVMLDCYEMLRAAIDAAGVPARLGVGDGDYAVVTLHRPSNVDDAATLGRLVEALRRLAGRLRLVFPVHPRTRRRLEETGLLAALSGHPAIRLVAPLGYIDFMSLVGRARLAVTDSGGLQEETTYLGIPCITVRPNTERPVTVSEGTNRLATVDMLGDLADRALDGDWPTGRRPALWDGRAAGRVVEALAAALDGRPMPTFTT